MTIHYTGNQTFLIHTKATDLEMGKNPKIGTLILNGPGEYEVADVQVRGYQDAYLFLADDVTVLYIYNTSGLTEETVKAIEGDVDILLLTVDSDPQHMKGAMKAMNDLDPKVTIPTIDSQTHPFCKEIGGCPSPIDEFKVNTKDLTEGERRVVLLHARAHARR
jgi:hypothetical protein